MNNNATNSYIIVTNDVYILSYRSLEISLRQRQSKLREINFVLLYVNTNKHISIKSDRYKLFFTLQNKCNKLTAKAY